MNSTNKKTLAVRTIPQSLNRQAGRGPQTKPAIAQLKTAVSAQTVKRSSVSARLAPAVTPQAVQPKMANGTLMRKAPVAPPVYHPQATKIAQPKGIVLQRPSPVKPVPVRPPRITAPLMGAAIQRALARVAEAPNIESIAKAFPILGAKMQKEYDKIAHDLPDGTPLADMLATYRARLKVLKMFRQAILANGMNGATARQNQAFKAGEAGHITALVNLAGRIAERCEEDEVDVPSDVITDRAMVAQELNAVTLKKHQAK